MNGRVFDAETPEERLAAVVISTILANERRNLREGTAHILDYQDFAAALKPFIQRELVTARMEEIRFARSTHPLIEERRKMLVERQKDLLGDLIAAEKKIFENLP